MSRETKDSDHVRAFAAYPLPFRFVPKDDDDKWKMSYDDVNRSNYDYVKLSRLTTYFEAPSPDVGAVCLSYSGAFIIPVTLGCQQPEVAAGIVNRLLGKMLLGGVYSESVVPRDIVHGVLYETGYFRPIGTVLSKEHHLQVLIQTRCAGPVVNMALYHVPQVLAQDLHSAYDNGSKLCRELPKLSTELVARAVSALVTRAFDDALALFWIAIEQVLFHLWKTRVQDGVASSDSVSSFRRKFLKDVRTWTVSSQVEMLFQLGHLDEEIYRCITAERQSRNELAHQGTTPNIESVDLAFEGLFRLIALACRQDSNALAPLVQKYKSLDPLRTSTPKEEPRAVPLGGRKVFGPLPPIPGERGWGDKPYEPCPVLFKFCGDRSEDPDTP